MKICSNCQSTTTYVSKQGRENWCRYKGNRICLKCYHKLIATPRRTKEDIKKYNDRRKPGFNKKYNDKWNLIFSPRRLQFLNKSIILDENPRKGECQKCSKKIGEEYTTNRGQVLIIKNTNMHHWFYLPIMVWACTEELCASCHGKIGNSGQFKSKDAYQRRR